MLRPAFLTQLPTRPGPQAYANVCDATPATRAFMVALAEAACERDAYGSIAQAGWALTVVDALSDGVLRRVRSP